MSVIYKLSALVFALLLPSLAIAQSAEMKSLPGMRGTQHIGITVPDVDKAVEFFVDTIGCEPFYSIGPFGPFDNDWMTVNLNVDPKAVITIATLVRCGNGPAYEIFEYTAPDQDKTPPKNSDIGGHHVAFYVDDMKTAVQFLRDRGVEVLGAPHTFEDTGMKGLSWVYFMAPWGLQMEIVSYPFGQGYERTTGRRMWDPRY